MDNLQQTLELEDINDIVLLPEEYDDAFIGIDSMGTDKAVYSSDLLDRISEHEEWMEVWENMSDIKKCPVIMECQDEYDKVKIPDVMKGAIIGLSMDGRQIVVSHAKLVEEIISNEECNEDVAMDRIEELKDELKSKRSRKSVLVIEGIDGYDDMYNALSFQDYKIDEEDDEGGEYDDTELLSEIDKNIRLQ